MKIHIFTYRLNAHSKGDDDRCKEELSYFKRLDPLNLALGTKVGKDIYEKQKSIVENFINTIDEIQLIDYANYHTDQLPKRTDARQTVLTDPVNSRTGNLLNEFYIEQSKNGSFHIGEDIIEPYGGAFKITKAINENIYSMPISEAGLVGFSVGISLMGKTVFAEIMFGDFITYAFDQIINNISKFYHMYNKQFDLPIRIRTPMGGGRGYGPTHSQSLEKYLCGIDNLAVVALTSLDNPNSTLSALHDYRSPFIIIESKVDYTKNIFVCPKQLEITRYNHDFGEILIRPKNDKPNATLISYGEHARFLADNYDELFYETDLIFQILCLTKLHPLNFDLISKICMSTDQVVICEGGSTSYGIGCQIKSTLSNSINPRKIYIVGSDNVPIPSPRVLETLHSLNIDKIKQCFN